LKLPIKIDKIKELFHPKAIAFVGATSDFSKWGHLMFSSVIAGNYEGNIYLVNVKGGEIAGRKVYKSVTEIPDPVDFAVVTVPAQRVLPLIEEFKQKNIKNVLLISSGFGETGTEGKNLRKNW